MLVSFKKIGTWVLGNSIQNVWVVCGLHSRHFPFTQVMQVGVYYLLWSDSVHVVVRLWGFDGKCRLEENVFQMENESVAWHSRDKVCCNLVPMFCVLFMKVELGQSKATHSLLNVDSNNVMYWTQDLVHIHEKLSCVGLAINSAKNQSFGEFWQQNHGTFIGPTAVCSLRLRMAGWNFVW